jgi:hypothetical protein
MRESPRYSSRDRVCRFRANGVCDAQARCIRKLIEDPDISTQHIPESPRNLDLHPFLASPAVADVRQIQSGKFVSCRGYLETCPFKVRGNSVAEFAIQPSDPDAFRRFPVSSSVQRNDDVAFRDQRAAERLVEVIGCDVQFVMFATCTQAVKTIGVVIVVRDCERKCGSWRFDLPAMRRDDRDRRTSIDRNNAVVDALTLGRAEIDVAAVSIECHRGCRPTTPVQR